MIVFKKQKYKILEIKCLNLSNKELYFFEKYDFYRKA